MNRRRLAILLFVASTALAGAVSCTQDTSDSVQPASSQPGGTAGFGAAGSDRPLPAPLPPYGPTDETAARRSAAARRAAARRAASARGVENEAIPTAGNAEQVTVGPAL